MKRFVFSLAALLLVPALANQARAANSQDRNDCC